jgi:hypothetical protein
MVEGSEFELLSIDFQTRGLMMTATMEPATVESVTVEPITMESAEAFAEESALVIFAIAGGSPFVAGLKRPPRRLSGT